MKRSVVLLAAATLSATAAHAIVGGEEHKGPLARRSVMVLSSNGGVCSAVVVAPDVVLTAAHCVTGAAEHRVHFRDEAGQPVLIAPAAKAVHPAYDAKAIATRRRSIDLALLRVPEPLPSRFEVAPLATGGLAAGETVTVGGWGLSRRDDPKTTGTFRTTSLNVIEPYGPSRILLWSQGTGAMGACRGDSGGPMAAGATVVAITSWSTPAHGQDCGGVTQGILVAPQRAWIDQTLARWNRSAAWSGTMP